MKNRLQCPIKSCTKQIFRIKEDDEFYVVLKEIIITLRI